MITVCSSWAAWIRTTQAYCRFSKWWTVVVWTSRDYKKSKSGNALFDLKMIKFIAIMIWHLTCGVWRSVSFGKDRKSADNFLVSFRNNTQGRVRPVPPPKPVVSSPTVRMNTHLQSAQNLLNELIQISVTGAANTAPAPPQQSDVWTLYLSDFKSSTFLSHNSINKKSKLVKQNNIICFCCLLVNNSGEMNESV